MTKYPSLFSLIDKAKIGETIHITWKINYCFAGPGREKSALITRHKEGFSYSIDQYRQIEYKERFLFWEYKNTQTICFDKSGALSQEIIERLKRIKNSFESSSTSYTSFIFMLKDEVIEEIFDGVIDFEKILLGET